jgi:choline dehydrogenase-like flavoprotein
MRWIVVGGGSAGCVAAARLSERSDREVVVLESGPDHGELTADDDVGPYVRDPQRLRSDAVARTDGGPLVPYLRGHGLAGTSLINGGVVTDPESPSDHQLPLQDPWADGEIGRALLASDPVARRVRLIRRGNRRVTAADAYLRPVLDRPNLTVATGVDVRRLHVVDRTVSGVLTSDGSLIEGDRVVMCAGAIHTPVILLRSGIDTPGVGDGLEDHPAFTIGLRVHSGVANPADPTISVAADHPHHQVVAMNHVAGVPDMAALVVALVEPRGRGRVRLRGDEPVVELNQLAMDDDARLLAEAVAATAATLEHPAWSDIVEEVYVDDAGTTLASIGRSPDRLSGAIVERLGGYFHAAATCREGVVTDGGAVRGYAGLFVADASALRRLPRHDPYVHVITNADRLVSGW